MVARGKKILLIFGFCLFYVNFFFPGFSLDLRVPVIQTINPAVITAGNEFVIKGNALGSDRLFELGLFVRTEGRVIQHEMLKTSSWSETEIKSKIPGYIPAGDYLIGIWYSAEWRYLTDVKVKILKNVESVPTIVDLSPREIYRFGVMTVRGRNFTDQAKYTLMLCQEGDAATGQQLKILEWTDSKIVAVAPNNYGSGKRLLSFWEPNTNPPIKYTDNVARTLVAPKMESVNPVKIYKNSSVRLTIKGRYLGDKDWYSVQIFNTVFEKYLSWNDNEIVMEISDKDLKDLPLGKHKVSLVSKYSDNAKVSEIFDSVQTGLEVRSKFGHIDSITPRFGLPEAEIEIHGRDFILNGKKGLVVITSALGDGMNRPFSASTWNDTRIKATLPGRDYLKPGKYLIYLQPEERFTDKTNSIPFEVTGYPKPILKSISVRQGMPGTRITVSGQNLQPVKTKTPVLLITENASGQGGSFLPYVKFNGTDYESLIPEDYWRHPGQYYIYIRTEDEYGKQIQTNALPFKILPYPKPAINSVSPHNIYPGSDIVIRGNDFIIEGFDFSRLSLSNNFSPEGTTLPTVVWTKREIKAKIPPRNYEGREGEYILQIHLNKKGFKIQSNGFKIKVEQKPAPVVVSMKRISPSEGPPGTKIVITGENLGLMWERYLLIDKTRIKDITSWNNNRIEARISASLPPGLMPISLYDRKGDKLLDTLKFKVLPKNVPNQPNDSKSSTRRIALKASNGKYVCADQGLGGQVVANRSSAGAWETFEIVDTGGGTVAFKTSYGKYITADLGLGGKLYGNRNNIGAWEKFKMVNIGGSKIALKAANGKYVCADQGAGNILIANRTSIGDWEKFLLINR